MIYRKKNSIFMYDIYFEEENLTVSEINRLITDNHENYLLNEFYNMQEIYIEEVEDGKTDVL